MSASVRGIHVYYAYRRQLSDSLVTEWVTDDDQRRLTPGMHERRRSEYLAARALLRYAIARHSGANQSRLPIGLTPVGKPQRIAGLEISVSHSGDIAACAVAAEAGGAIGIDVETTEPTDGRPIAERYFTPAEGRWVGADPDARFRQLWVLKEAYLKMLGVGLAGGLDSLECRIEETRIVARVTSGAAPQLALLAGSGCYLGVASADVAPFELNIERWAPVGDPDALEHFRVSARTE